MKLKSIKACNFVFQTEFALDLLSKFEMITALRPDMTERYHSVLRLYGCQLEQVRQLYQSDKTDPSVSRNLPPIAGRIAWARQLFWRIEAPMKILKVKLELTRVEHSHFPIESMTRCLYFFITWASWYIFMFGVFSQKKDVKLFAITTNWLPFYSNTKSVHSINTVQLFWMRLCGNPQIAPYTTSPSPIIAVAFRCLVSGLMLVSASCVSLRTY